MNAAIEQLEAILVADLMNRNVVTISANSTMAEAAEVLSRNHISGAPVVNELKQYVGILSTTDFARRDQSQCDGNILPTPAGEFMLVRDEGSGPFHIEHVAENLVSQHMSCAIQTISSEQSMIDAARYMQGEHIHRLVVVDEQSLPVGIISVLDILAALVTSIDAESRVKDPKGIT